MGLHRQHAKEGVLNVMHDLEDLRLWRAVFCEFFGTFVFIFIGLTNIIASEASDKIDNLVTPGWTFAAIIATMIHIIGPTSGCHMNPAVTIALVVQKRCPALKGIMYVIVQLAGAVAGAALTYAVSPQEWIEAHDLGRNKLNPKLNHAQGLVFELVGTCVLILLVLVISDHDPKKDFEGFPSLSAGLAVLALVYFMGPYTGCSLNPARSFGPSLVMMKFGDYHWIYWVGPIGGGMIAVFIYNFFLIQGLHKFDEPIVKADSESSSRASSSHQMEEIKDKAIKSKDKKKSSNCECEVAMVDSAK